jgi:ribosome-associated protein
MIRVTPEIYLNESEIQEEFIRASGPGGQNINKVSSGVQLRFDVLNSPSLPEGVRQRLIRLADRRINEAGILVIEAKQFRTQNRNRQEALNRLVELIQKAAIVPKPRHKTRPTTESKRRRVAAKRRRSQIKKLRQRPSSEELGG